MGVRLTCRDVADRASLLIDGELGGWDRVRIRLHLAVCSGCTHFLHQMRQTRALIAASAAIPAAEAPAAKLDAILARVRG